MGPPASRLHPRHLLDRTLQRTLRAPVDRGCRQGAGESSSLTPMTKSRSDSGRARGFACAEKPIESSVRGRLLRDEYDCCLASSLSTGSQTLTPKPVHQFSGRRQILDVFHTKPGVKRAFLWLPLELPARRGY